MTVRSSSDRFVEGLNEAQAEAVQHDQGPLLVLAGAGSGKTRVITHRMARLISRGCRPEAILGVTFTNKAATEMRERMAPLVGKEAAEQIWLSTFHAFGLRFLSEERHVFGEDGRFVIFDQGDAIGLVRDIVRRHRIGERGLDVMAILSRISLWKNRFMMPPPESMGDDRDERAESEKRSVVSPRAVLKRSREEPATEYDIFAAQVMPLYQEALRDMRAVDFDDLVVRPAQILRENEALRAKWKNRFRHLLIDEFQDTNHAQLELVRLLTNDIRNICVVGDDDQSIYGWRGADVQNILDFEHHFRGATVVKLEDNYRSRSAIVELANHAIAQSRAQRHRKVLRATRGQGETVRLAVLEDPLEEVKFVVREVRDLHKAGRSLADIAVLYRSNLQARLVEEELRIEDLPYRLVGGTQFFDRKEVKDGLAYLRLVVNPYDELAFRRIVNYPPRGIGTTSLEKIVRFAKSQNKPLAIALGDNDLQSELSVPAKAGANSLFGALTEAKRGFKSGALASTAQRLFEKVRLVDDLQGQGSVEQVRKRLDNLKFVTNSLARYEQGSGRAKDDRALGTFLHQLTLHTERNEEEKSGEKITLCTLHGSKGLEFGTVFLIGCVEGQLPHNRTLDPKVTEAAPTDVEEERRLFYVGVTRARDLLYLTRTRKRLVRGTPRPVTPSRFICDLPETLAQPYSRQDKVVTSGSESIDEAKAILEMLRSSSN